MNDQPSRPSPVALFAWSLALIVTGVRLAVLSYAGSPVPFYDQWVAEFNNLFVAVVSGTDFAALFTWHNEHLLFTTRLLSLLGYFFNGYWDVTLLSVLSALVRAATAMWTFRLLASGLTGHRLTAVWLLCAVAYATPLSAYNLLSGLQVSFYLTDLALLASLHVMLRWAGAFSSGAALILGTLAGVTSMASGIAIPAATLAVQLVHRRPRPGFWIAWAGCAGISAAYALPIVFNDTIDYTFPDYNFAKFAAFLLQLLSWPHFTAAGGMVAIALVAAGMIFLLRTRPREDEGPAALAGLGVFALAGVVLIAANRDPSTFHPRHWDAVGLLPVCALALGIRLSGPDRLGHWATRLTAAAGALYVVHVALLSWTVCFPTLRESHQRRDEVVAHYRDMLLSRSALEAEDRRIRSMMDRQDFSFFDDPVGKHALHPVVIYHLIYFRTQTGDPPHLLLSPEILPIRPPSFFSRITAGVRDWGWLAAVAGLVTGFAALRRNDDRNQKTEAGRQRSEVRHQKSEIRPSGSPDF